MPRDQLPSTVTFVKGLPETFSHFPENSLIVIDDAQAEAAGSKAVLDLFTRGSHHKFQNCILNCQNVFFEGKYNRSLALNTHVYVLFRSIRDKAQIAHFFRQISPTYWRELVAAFESATTKQYSYFIVDCHPATDNPKLRFRTQIFPDDPFQILYCLPDAEDH